MKEPEMKMGQKTLGDFSGEQLQDQRLFVVVERMRIATPRTVCPLPWLPLIRSTKSDFSEVKKRTQIAHKNRLSCPSCPFCPLWNQQVAENREPGIVQLRPWPPCFQLSVPET
jgi:hypothetical protein